jgi:hypothetical protein
VFLHWIILSIIIVWCVLKDIWWVSERVLLYLVSEWASVVISGEWVSERVLLYLVSEWVSECCYIWWVSERVLLYLVSEWASVVISGERVFNSKWAIFQLYLSRWEQVTFRWDDNDFHFVLDPELSWIFL